MLTSSIFLSYARVDDEPFVKKLYEDLAAQGFRVWWDRMSMPNRALTFLQEIRDAIDRADCLVLVIGSGVMQSDYVRAEWQHALEYCKPVHPVLRVGDYDLLPPELALLDTPDFRDDNRYDQSLEHLLRHLHEPVAPLGKLVAVPELPPHYLARPSDLTALKQPVLADVQKPVVVTGTARRVGLHGMGGIGKSVLAAALARECDVRRAFPNGVLWVTIGQSPNLTLRQYDLCLTLDSPPPHPFVDVNAGKTHLSTVLADKRCLLILDDVWQVEHAQAFDALGPYCRILLTTRDAELITALGAHEHRLEILSEDDALTLMAGWLLSENVPEQEHPDRIAQPRTDLPTTASEVAHECGYLPLALALSAAQVRDGTPWVDLLDALREADLEFFDHPHGSILKSLKVSIDALHQTNPDHAQHYLELAVFPEDTPVPEATVLTLWLHTNGINERRARQLIRVLSGKALISSTGEQPHRQIKLHDLQHIYLRQVLEDLNAAHNELIEAYQKKCANGWHTGPNDGYFFEHLAYHLHAAGRNDDLRGLFANQNWLRARFEHDDYNYSGYVRDLMLTWEHVAHAEALRQIEAGEEPVAIADCIRYALIRTSINSLASNYVPELITQAVETGLWTPNRAMKVAPYVPDPAQRAVLYTILLSTGQLNEADSIKVQQDALKAIWALAMRHGDQNQAILALAPNLEPELLMQTLDIAPGLAYKVERATEEQKAASITQALESAREIKSKGQQVTALAGLFLHLTETQKNEVLESAFNLTLSIENFWQLDTALVALRSHLTKAQRATILEHALHLAMSKEKPSWNQSVEQLQTQDLVKLAPHLEGDLLIKVLDIAMGFENEWNRARVLAALVPQLKGDLLAQVFDAALALEMEAGQRMVLVALVPQLADDILIQVREAALAFENEWNRADVLVALAQRLGGDLLDLALDAVLTIKEEYFREHSRPIPKYSRVKHLVSLAPQLEDNLLARALDAAMAIENEKWQADVLVALAPQLEGDLLTQALNTALAIEDASTQAAVLLELSFYSTGKQKEQILTETLEVVLRLKNRHLLAKFAPQLEGKLLIKALDSARIIAPELTQAAALGNLFGYLEDATKTELLQQALHITQTMMKDTQSAMLVALAPHLDDALLLQALEDAQAIEVEGERLWALAALIPHLEDKQKAIMLGQTLDAILAYIDSEWDEASMLETLVPQLDEELLDHGLESALKLGMEESRTQAIRFLASHPENILIEQRLEATLTLRHDLIKASILEELAPHLEGELLTRAIEGAQGLGDAGAKEMALAALQVEGTQKAELLTRAKDVPELLPQKWRSIGDRLLTVRSEKRTELLRFCADKRLFAPPIFTQEMLATIAGHITEICWEWTWL